jgi:Rhs element Vgr protein
MSGERTIPPGDTGEQARLRVLVSGQALPQALPVQALSVWKRFNRISSATLVIQDGDPAEENFEWSSSDHFKPGNEIEIKAGYARSSRTIFKGVVIAQKIKVRSHGDPQLLVECRDKAYSMTLARKNRYYEEVTDSDIIEEIVSEYALSDQVSSTSFTHKQMVQYRSTDWDFIVMRAEANGMAVLTDDGRLKVLTPDLTAAAQFSVIFGATLLEFDGELDGRIPSGSTEALGWHPPDQDTERAENGAVSESQIGDLDASQLARDAGYGKEELISTGVGDEDELTAWANASQFKKVNAKVRGRAKFQGTASISPGKLVDLQGLGSRMNGKALVWGIRHELSKGAWTTDAELGIPDRFFHEENVVAGSQASGLLPPVHGLEIGIVTALEDDPDGEYRIKVKIPTLDKQAEGTWARIATLDAGNERGSFFMPEIGDEVVLGFLNDDPRHPLILGMLHSSAKPAPSTPADDNHEKGLVTRSGMKIWFDDDKVHMILETPNGNKITLSDEEGTLSLEDENGNTMVMDSSGIALESATDISVKAAGSVIIEGSNIAAQADVEFKAQGASSKLTADGIAEVSGSLVKIN